MKMGERLIQVCDVVARNERAFTPAEKTIWSDLPVMMLLRSISRVDLGRATAEDLEDTRAGEPSASTAGSTNDRIDARDTRRARSGFRSLDPREVESGRLFGANLSEQMLNEVSLPRADLRQASLRGASLRGADLHRADLTEAECSEADFSEGDLREATFVLAILRHAAFRNADLSGANFYAADISGADFTGAVFSGARFPDVRWDPDSTKFPTGVREQLMKVSVRISPHLYRVGSMRDDRTTISGNT
ncbi:pentapeptide repeat-containing protein [Pseudonocardia sp. DLS-67]